MLTDGTGYAMGDPASGGRFVVLKTTDFGQSWVHTAEPVGGASEAGWVNSFWLTDANHIWFGTNASRVWRSTDGGTSWLSAASGSTNSYTVAFKDNNSGLVGHDNGLMRATGNGGATWSSSSSPTSTAIQGMAYVNGTNSAWVSAGAIPYRSVNNGSSWTSQTVYPISGAFNHISFADTAVGWGVTSNGEVVRYRAPGTTSVETTTTAPNGFALEQNYPNPFNPSTVIRFSINQPGLTSLRVYSLLGKEVATLVQEELNVGTYSVTFDGSELSSGVYFYTLRSGALVDSKRLLLLK
jgi:photosystem II stability/assembly factor-like uncharacterized protein